MDATMFIGRFVLLNIFLLCLLIGRGRGEPVNSFAQKGVPLSLSGPPGATDCTLKYPDQTTKKLTEGCSISITLLDGQKTGDYIISGTVDAAPQTVTYSVHLLVPTLPNEPTIAAGENLIISMADTSPIKDLDSCTTEPATPPTGTSTVIINGKCGIKISAAKKEAHASLKLLSKAINNELYASDVSLTVYDAIKADAVKYVDVHDAAHTILNVHDTSAPVKYCYYETNRNIQTEIKPTCEHELSPATKSHEGIWFVNTGYEGTTLQVRQEVNITVADKIGSIGTWKKNENSQYELTCNVGKPITMCRFVQSSTKINVSLSDGVGNENYQYIGRGLEKGDCGMTILKEAPKEKEDEDDLWKCYWAEEKGTFNRLLILNNKNTTGNYITDVAKSKHLEVDGKLSMYAIVGMENVELECYVEGAVLDYCWFTAPDGTNHIPENINEHELRHGICKYNITVGERDGGLWTCRLGVFARGEEMTKKINVMIANSLLQAENSGVEVVDNTATISCAIVDTSTKLRYCRYVRPDGVGLTLPFGESLNNYQSLNTEKDGKCQLKINLVQNYDIGSWTCAARLFDSSINREHMDYVYVYNSGLSGGQIAGIVIGVLLIIAAIGGILFYFLKIRRSR